MKTNLTTRRDFLKVTGLAAAGGLLPFQCQKEPAVKKAEFYYVYVGTYTSGGCEGIYVYKMDMSDGSIMFVQTVGNLKNPSFLAIDSTDRFLYTFGMISNADGKQEPVVSAYSIDVKTGMLSFLNRQPIPGRGTCHINVDKTGKYVLTANYSDGNVSMFPVLADGGLDKMSDFVQHTGSGPNEKRQKAAHAHSINISPDNKYAYAADLGIDKVMIYKLDLENGKLVPNEPPFAKVAPGAGPRHFDFHPNGQFAYVINELNSTVTAFTYNQSDGSLTEIQTVLTLPEGFSEINSTADIHVSPCGKYLYGSNRGHDSIAIFSVDTNTGMLSPVGHEPTQGSTPRNFAVDPTGRYLLAENQRSGTIVIFRIDKATGKLIPTGNVVEVPSPVCIKMIPVGG